MKPHVHSDQTACLAKLQCYGRASIVDLHGQFNETNVRQLTGVLRAAIGRKRLGAVLLCLRRLASIDSGFMHVLLSFGRAATRAGVEVAIVVPESDGCRRVFDLMELAPAVHTFSTRDEAIAYIQSIFPIPLAG